MLKQIIVVVVEPPLSV